MLLLWVYDENALVSSRVNAGGVRALFLICSGRFTTLSVAMPSLQPPAPCVRMRSMFQYVPRYTRILANTCQYTPKRTQRRSVEAPPLPSACAAAARKDRIGYHTRAVPSRKGAPNIKARRRFTAEWLYTLPPYKAIASNTCKGYWHYSSLHAARDDG